MPSYRSYFFPDSNAVNPLKRTSLSQATSKGFTFTLPSPSSSPRSICPPPPFPHPVRGWINVWLWETCRWQMFTFIMHDFHVAVNFSEPAKSRKWFCTLCLFNEIVTLMEVRLNKMEMTVSVCRFYDLFFFYIATSFHIITLTRYLWTNAILTELRQTVGGILLDPWKSFICSQLVVSSACSQSFLAIYNVYVCWLC